MHPDSRRYLAASLIFLLGAGATQTALRMRGVEAIYRPDFSRIPLEVGEYKGKRVPVDHSLYQVLEAQAMEERIYSSPRRSIALSLIYGTDWRTIHAPTGCYPAQGWHIVHDTTMEVPAPPDCPHPGPLQAHVLEVTKGERRELAVYVYARPGATTSDWTAHGFKVATGPPGAGGMIITLRTPVGSGDSESARQELVKLLRAIYTPSVSFWYHSDTRPNQPASG